MEIIQIAEPNKIAGGYTFNYYTGLFEHLKTFDFAGLYPSTIIECNIAPETIITKEIADKHNIPYCRIPMDIHAIKKNEMDYNSVLNELINDNIIKKIDDNIIIEVILPLIKNKSTQITELTFLNLLKDNNIIEPATKCSREITSIFDIFKLRANSKFIYGVDEYKFINKSILNDMVINIYDLPKYKDCILMGNYIIRYNNNLYSINNIDLEQILNEILYNNRKYYIVVDKDEYNNKIIEFNNIDKSEYNTIDKYKIVVKDKKYYKWGDIYYPEKYFRKDIIGSYSNLLIPIIKERYDRKYGKNKYYGVDNNLYNKLDAEEKGLKIMLNSLYGLNGYTSFRLYSPYIANAITQLSRQFIKRMIKEAEECGCIVIAGDTDSIFIQTPKELSNDKLENIFKNSISEFIIENNLMNSGYMKFEYEKDYLKLLYFKKKFYATTCQKYDENGNKIGDVDIEVKGLLYKKKDTTDLVKYWQKMLVEDCILLNKMTINDYINELYKFKEKLIKGDIDVELLVFRKVISKSLDKYGGDMIDKNTGKPKIKKDGSIQQISIPAHINLAKRLHDRGLDIGVGETVEYVVKSSNPRLDVIWLDDYINGDKEFDKNYYYSMIIKAILPLINIIDSDLIYSNLDLWFIKEPRDKIKHINKLIGE